MIDDWRLPTVFCSLTTGYWLLTTDEEPHDHNRAAARF